VNLETMTFQQGMHVTLVTTASNPEAGRELLNQFGMPFAKTAKEAKEAKDASDAVFAKERQDAKDAKAAKEAQAAQDVKSPPATA
jgi:hypothetical protein